MDYKFSGHETFAFRYAWLPKAFNAIQLTPDLFSDENNAMVQLGVGKNMVRSIRFWASLTGIITLKSGRLYQTTPFGEKIFDQQKGFDPYLEDSQTLWLLHWRVSTANEPLFAWYYLLNRWQESEMIPSVIVSMIIRELEGQHKISKNSLESLLKVFFHTYVPTRGTKSKVLEDNLDCPLVQLKLIEFSGDKDGSSAGKKEPIYTFNRGNKPEIGLSLFLFCLCDFWKKSFSDERTLSYEQIANGLNSPGQVLKLSEEGIQDRLNNLTQFSHLFTFTDSSTSRLLERKFDDFEAVSDELLKGIYK